MSTPPKDSHIPETLAREADVKRANLNQTLDAVEQRFSADHLTQQAVDYFDEHGRDIANSVGSTIRHNPLPLLLTGFGLAWLIATQSRSSTSYDYDSGYDEHDSRYDDWLNRWDDEGGSHGHLHNTDVQNALSVANSESSASHNAPVYDFRGYRQEKKRNWMQEQPLVAGALGVAAGALIGALLPRSNTEDELIGDRADDVKSSLVRQAESAGDRAVSAVADKAEILRERGQEHLDQIEADRSRTESA